MSDSMCAVNPVSLSALEVIVRCDNREDSALCQEITRKRNTKGPGDLQSGFFFFSWIKRLVLSFCCTEELPDTFIGSLKTQGIVDWGGVFSIYSSYTWQLECHLVFLFLSFQMYMSSCITTFQTLDSFCA